MLRKTKRYIVDAEEVWYAIPQLEAYELLEPEQKDDPMVYPPQEVLDRCEVFVNLPQDIMQLADLHSRETEPLP